MSTAFQDYAQLQHELIRAIHANDPETGKAFDNTLELEWRHEAPMRRANELTRILGEPDRWDTKAGGVAIWRYVDPYFRRANVYTLEEGERFKPTNVYSKLMIVDEEVPHLVPIPHTDYYYAYMYMDIPIDKVADIRALSQSVGYDTAEREVYARCHFEAPLLTSLYLIKQMANGHKGLLHAQQEYQILIPTLAKEERAGHGLHSERPGPWHQALTNYTFSLDE
jgi:hypothetical protein